MAEEIAMPGADAGGADAHDDTKGDTRSLSIVITSAGVTANAVPGQLLDDMAAGAV